MTPRTPNRPSRAITTRQAAIDIRKRIEYRLRDESGDGKFGVFLNLVEWSILIAELRRLARQSKEKK